MSFEKHYKRVYEEEKIHPSIYDTNINFFYEYGYEDAMEENKFIIEHTGPDSEYYLKKLNLIDGVKFCRQVSSSGGDIDRITMNVDGKIIGINIEHFFKLLDV